MSMISQFTYILGLLALVFEGVLNIIIEVSEQVGDAI